MPARSRNYFIFIVLIATNTFSQDYHGYGGSNYGGLNSILANPAASADNCLKVDINLLGIDMSFNNSWLSIKQEALSRDRAYTWKNSLANESDNIYKNFNYASGKAPYSAVLEQRILMPSVFFQINRNNAVALTWAVRQIGNVDGISNQFAHLFENEFVLGVTQNNPVSNEHLGAIQMTWMEYGVNYGRVLLRKKQHFLKAGITPKLLQGIQSAYVMVDNLDFLFSNKDTLSYFRADVSFARSEGMQSAINLNTRPTYQNTTGFFLGLDIGLVYEWRPGQQISAARAPAKNKRTEPEYKLKFGAALVDIGKIRFQKAENYYDVNLDIDRKDIIRYLSAKNIQEVDSMVQVDFPVNSGSSDFTVLLPTALNLQLDYQVHKQIFLGAFAHISEFNRDEHFRVHNYSVITMAPRIESYWFNVSVPISYNFLSARRSSPVMPGIALRAGPLTIGSNDLSFLFKNHYASINFYMLLKVSIGQNKKKG